jgi:two-component system phosphate regulon sensor histidine kinase PhoR
MAIRLKRSYKFAFRTSFFISVILTLLLWLTTELYNLNSWVFLVVFIMSAFVIIFFIVQLRIEKFIYRRIKRIYDDVSLLESSSLTSRTITTDMSTLTEEIEKFAQDKKIEIDTLKIREEYRKDFHCRNNNMFHGKTVVVSKTTQDNFPHVKYELKLSVL